MLAIRLQRTGRSGHSQFRVIVQDSRLSPKSGKLVMQLGSYNPHTKMVVIDKEKASFYLEHGAQPSPRVAGLLKDEGVKLPNWVAKPTKKDGKIRNPDKLRTDTPVEKVSEDQKIEEPLDQQPTVETDTVVPTEESNEKTDQQEADADEVAVESTEEVADEEKIEEHPETKEKSEEKPAKT